MRTDAEQPVETIAIGVMSGTSLDGLDLALCQFRYDGQWHFHLSSCKCVPYTDVWREYLSTAHLLHGSELSALDVKFGEFIGEQVNIFREEQGIRHVDLICSHGHTVFHEPAKGITVQTGSGAAICSVTGIDTVCDFRSLDVALGGQGAPLVPMGDKLLFAQYDACLNLGGFANISFREENLRRAHDICPVNMGLNMLAQRFGRDYDENGDIARSGTVDHNLLDRLNRLPIYYTKEKPSFSREWFGHNVVQLLNGSESGNAHLMRTLTEHAACRISESLNLAVKDGSVLMSGGGVMNGFLLERIRALASADLVVPEDGLVNFKEALIFAFLGVLRKQESVNVLCSATGANRDSSSGIIYSS